MTAKKPTKREACAAALNRAAADGICVIAFAEPKAAKNWRDACYRLRQSLQTVGDARWDHLVISVVNSTLKIEAHGFSDQPTNSAR